MKRLYFDFAAATPTDPTVHMAMEPYFTEIFGNPSSAHEFGREALSAIERSKEIIADDLSAKPTEIFFTGSGTESNNLAILGVAKANKNKGKHLITTVIEHPSILNSYKALEKDGYEVTYLPVNRLGLINFEDLKKAIRKDTVLFSTHYGNSEIGVLQDAQAIGEICRSYDIYFHLDACQSMAFENIQVNTFKVDLLTFNGSKLYGPKGVAVLYVRENVTIFPIVYGGGQQQSLRSGTENVAGIVGLTKAVELAKKHRQPDRQRIASLRDYLQKQLEKLPEIGINANSDNRLANHLSVTLNQIDNADLVALYNTQGIALSAGSACSAKSLVESYVLRAISLDSPAIQSTVRITLGRNTTREDCDKIVQVTKEIRNNFAKS